MTADNSCQDSNPSNSAGFSAEVEAERTMTTHDGTSKAGAPRGNRNALRHGLRAGRLPPGCGAIRRAIDELRRSLEDAVSAARGTVNLLDATRIQSALRHETHAQLCRRWMRLEEGLDADRMLTFAREVVRATESRDRAIAALNLGGGGPDPLDALRAALASREEVADA